MKFYVCSVCGNLVEKIVDGGTTPACCGRQMRELVPASTDGALEKHVPVFEIIPCIGEGCETKIVSVRIGEAPHPMLSYHSIKWVVLETDKGVYRKEFTTHDAPEACFLIGGNETPVMIYAYCDLHGLWETKC